MAAPPAGMGLPTDSQRMGVAGAWLAPSEEPAVVGLATLESTAWEPVVP